MKGDVPQTPFTLGRKRVTLSCARPGRPSPITEAPLPPKLLTSAAVISAPGHKSEVESCLFGPLWSPCLVLVITSMGFTAAAAGKFFVYCKNLAIVAYHSFSDYFI